MPTTDMTARPANNQPCRPPATPPPRSPRTRPAARRQPTTAAIQHPLRSPRFQHRHSPRTTARPATPSPLPSPLPPPPSLHRQPCLQAAQPSLRPTSAPASPNLPSPRTTSSAHRLTSRRSPTPPRPQPLLLPRSSHTSPRCPSRATCSQARLTPLPPRLTPGPATPTSRLQLHQAPPRPSSLQHNFSRLQLSRRPFQLAPTLPSTWPHRHRFLHLQSSSPSLPLLPTLHQRRYSSKPPAAAFHAEDSPSPPESMPVAPLPPKTTPATPTTSPPASHASGKPTLCRRPSHYKHNHHQHQHLFPRRQLSHTSPHPWTLLMIVLPSLHQHMPPAPNAPHASAHRPAPQQMTQPTVPLIPSQPLSPSQCSLVNPTPLSSVPHASAQQPVPSLLQPSARRPSQRHLDRALSPGSRCSPLLRHPRQSHPAPTQPPSAPASSVADHSPDRVRPLPLLALPPTFHVSFASQAMQPRQCSDLQRPSIQDHDQSPLQHQQRSYTCPQNRLKPPNIIIHPHPLLPTPSQRSRK